MGIARVGLTVLFILFTAVTAQAAPEFAVQITGQIQGPFKGESTRKGFENKFMGLSFDQEVASPRDTATGQATGKRTFKPIRIKKAWGPASLQLYAALMKNELLTVVMDFFATDPSGLTVLDHTVKLSGAAVARYTSSADVSTTASQTDFIELVYQQIEITDHRAKTSVTDSWVAP
ncbi:MAG TPA: type VI secretion system tube protein TssD [Nitrospira sp.]|jgi:type VI secretion system secreted protein Hcp|nr:type VI secretion system tube protein TssD [Nitrospira sp.]